MSHKIPFLPIILKVGRLGTLMLLFVLLYCGNTWGAPCNYQDIDIQCNTSHIQGAAIYDNPGGTTITDKIELCPPPPATTTSVNWVFAGGAGSCTVTSNNVTCKDGSSTMVLTAPSMPGLSPLQFSGKVPKEFGIFTVTAIDTNNSEINCKRTYNFNTLLTSGGWGDPHITTVDGIHYDFQSAGEFTVLRGDGLEIQARQIPIATTFMPGADPYIGVPTCVALYSAVAAQVCNHRVSYQPNISGVPDPSGLQLRVDGDLVKLGPEGIDIACDSIVLSPTRGNTHKALSSTHKFPDGGRIVKSPVGDGIEIHYTNGTKLVVTPGWWPSQQKWYLNVNVYGTTATEGIFGKLAKDSWLPALPDGASLGSKPESLHQRYVDLYKKFAHAWRVTNETSLFDYAHGTSTATFTHSDWPRENPRSCAIEGEPSAQPVDVSVAEKHCSAIVDKNMKADCIFDVSVTGHTGFAQTYQITERLHPGATVTMVKDDKDPTKSGENVSFIATVAPKVPRGGSTPTGTVQFIVDGRHASDTVTLDSSGRASWSTSKLEVGQHQIVAKYTPSGWGSLFMASSSPEESHAVIAGQNLYLWLIILLIIILLIFIIKRRS